MHRKFYIFSFCFEFHWSISRTGHGTTMFTCDGRPMMIHTMKSEIDMCCRKEMFEVWEEKKND